VSSLPAPPPDVNPETAPFWAATAQGKLLLRRCNDCGGFIWYPRALCPECMSMNTEWYEAAGTGTIYSYSLNNRGLGAYRGVPFVLAYVELTEGPRVMTNIVTDHPENLAVGDAVRVIFDDTGEGNALYRFEPA
jgi:uncharacterized OB-fold protein